MSGPKTAMVMAAGLGTRMRPLTNDRPKALVEVAGRPLIDHTLDRLQAAGVERAVVNVHAFADLLEAHLKARAAPTIAISDERAELLETGGGMKKALPLLGEGPFWGANIDCVWIETGRPALEAMAQAWDPARMDVLLMLAPTATSLGFHAEGDFFLETDGALRFRGEAPVAPWLYVGLHIAKPEVFEGTPEGAFSLTRIWRPLAERGRLHGFAPEGLWMHAGDPAARDVAEARLKAVAA